MQKKMRIWGLNVARPYKNSTGNSEQSTVEIYFWKFIDIMWFKIEMNTDQWSHREINI
jgi:hypothetical protein